MTRVQIFLILAVTLALFSTIQGKPIFWLLPWNSWLYPTTSSSSTSSTSSTATSRTPTNASITIGDRTNTNAGVDDYGTSISGLTITAGRRRRRSPEQSQDIALPSNNESYIQIGNHVIRIPSRVISNVTINVVDGVPYVEQGGIPTPPANPGFFDHIRNIFDGFFNRTN